MSDQFRDAVDVERRRDQHGGISTYVLANGSRAATTSGALSAAIGRAVFEQHREASHE